MISLFRSKPALIAPAPLTAKSKIMETTYYMVLDMKTIRGFETIGRFNIGNNSHFAHTVFNQLEGSRAVSESNILHLDFVEMRDGLPVNLNMISCTLDQLSENFKTITRETFKQYNLEGRKNNE